YCKMTRRSGMGSRPPIYLEASARQQRDYRAPHCVRDCREELNSHSPVIRAGLGILDFVSFISAIGILWRTQTPFTQLKAGIQTASQDGSRESGNGHDASGIIEQRPGD